MSDNERKTFIMYKRAETKRNFNTNIIPKFTNEKDNYTAKDDFGEWKIRVDNYANSGLTANGPNLSAMFDHDEETYCCIRNYGWAKGSAWFYLELPKNVSICPSSISFKAEGSWQKKFYVQGYNITKQTWETITNTMSPSDYGEGLNAGVRQTFTVNATGKSNFYTQFRMHWHDQYSGSGSDTYIWSFEITEGIIHQL